MYDDSCKKCPIAGQFRIMISFYKDIRWFDNFLEYFNGSVKIAKTEIADHHIFVGACQAHKIRGNWRI